ncbi:hypothetical protein [Streptomyces fuscigenes]|uniref:hypothetical protein n=1 Tax=Streptomyces fuscigenes TaxID=1528880 RepID=UPI001F1FEC0B|nr:hypothetical protein [Streptomyces fuscigenes]MCF3960321.1 hypothetical protein [Streptomyces fuscigenes]
MPEHVAYTSTGMLIVEATEPVPGLHVYEIPTQYDARHRWMLAHHEGHALAAFDTDAAATEAAGVLAPLADWTRSVMTAANEISLNGRTDLLRALMAAAGGHQPNG